MIHKIQTYIEANHLLTNNNPIIVGFSGGGDSVSLLFILNSLGYKCIAAHCNFHLRGDESNRDEQFCIDFTEKHNIPLEKTDFDTESYAANNHLSIEMAARELRYQWFEKIRKSHNAQAIAIAHHSDDSVETMLLNMIRGTGIRGLCGIRPKNGYIVRPMLCVGREDILRYLDEQHLQYVTDSTNLSDKYTRNFIRLQLIPMMEKINPSIKTSLSRTSEHLSDAEIIYTHVVEHAKKTLLNVSGDEISISIKDLMKYPAPKTILYELIKPYGFSRLTSEDVFGAINGISGKMFEAMSSDYKLLKDRDLLLVYKQHKDDSSYMINEVDFANANLPIKLFAQKIEVDNTFTINKSPKTVTLDYDKIHFPLILRHWNTGDWFIPFGMNGRQKLSDFFSNNKYNRVRKNDIWLLCDDKNIIWIIGIRADNRFRIEEKTKNALIINFSE